MVSPLSFPRKSHLPWQIPSISHCAARSMGVGVSHLRRETHVHESRRHGDDVGDCDPSRSGRPAEEFVALDVHVCVGDVLVFMAPSCVARHSPQSLPHLIRAMHLSQLYIPILKVCAMGKGPTHSHIAPRPGPCACLHRPVSHRSLPHHHPSISILLLWPAIWRNVGLMIAVSPCVVVACGEVHKEASD